MECKGFSQISTSVQLLTVIHCLVHNQEKPYFHQKSCKSKFQQRICYTILDVTPVALITEKGNHCQRCPRRELNLFMHVIHTISYERKQRVTYSQKINGHYFVITFNINCNEILYIISYFAADISYGTGKWS